MYSNLYDIRATLLICCHKLVDKLFHRMKTRIIQFNDEKSSNIKLCRVKSKLRQVLPW